jgi:molybdopterin-guanine dinucleotide biosynthesis protein A
LLGVPCDTPFLPADLGSRLLARAEADAVPLVRAADETGIHYAVMLMHRSLLGALEDYVKAGGRQVRAWQETQATGTVDFADDPYAFLNVNSPEDLRQAERLAPRYLR